MSRSRQQRKAAARVALRTARTREEFEASAFRPIIGEVHPYGNRSMRRHARAVRRRQVGDGWRVGKAKRGERLGRRLEQLIRSGAPLATVRAERTIMRALLG